MSTWVIPNGTAPDFSSTFNQSSELQIVWNSIDPNSFENTLSTLWVTTFDFDTTSFSQLLAENVDTKDNGIFHWTIAIPSDVLSTAAKYVLRFKDPNPEYNASSEQDPSPGFIIINGDAMSSSSSSSSSSTINPTTTITTTSVISTTGSTTTPTTSVISTTGSTTTPTASAMPHDSSHGISNGAIAGIAVVAAGAFILIIWLTHFLYKRRQLERKSSTCDAAPKQQPTYFQDGPTHISDGRPMELEATGLGQRGPVELQG